MRQCLSLQHFAVRLQSSHTAGCCCTTAHHSPGIEMCYMRRMWAAMRKWLHSGFGRNSPASGLPDSLLDHSSYCTGHIQVPLLRRDSDTPTRRR